MPTSPVSQGSKYPQVPGHEVIGVVNAIGSKGMICASELRSVACLLVKLVHLQCLPSRSEIP
jgi:hypothetical protein